MVQPVQVGAAAEDFHEGRLDEGGVALKNGRQPGFEAVEEASQRVSVRRMQLIYTRAAACPLPGPSGLGGSAGGSAV